MRRSVTAVIPNRNYARHLADRIGSVLGQDRVPDALVFLDDASEDESWEVAAGLLAGAPCPVTVRRNETCSGSVLHQWRAGVAEVRTDFTWIAEADDRAAPGMLGVLAAGLEADREAIFAFCQSTPIDEAGARIAEDDGYFTLGELKLLAADAVFGARDFLARGLCPRNMVVSASGVLWRTDRLRAALDAVAPEIGRWLCAGDWRVYAAACEGGGTIHHVAKPLNEHRRHPGSVTGSTRAPRHFSEVVAMHAYLRDLLGAAPARDRLMRQHLDALRAAWGLETPRTVREAVPVMALPIRPAIAPLMRAEAAQPPSVSRADAATLAA
jgi:hypothetical protein